MVSLVAGNSLGTTIEAGELSAGNLTLGHHGTTYHENLTGGASLAFGNGGTPRRSAKVTVASDLTYCGRLKFKAGTKQGSPSGDVTFAIRKVSDDSAIISEVWGNASAFTATTASLDFTSSPFTVPAGEYYFSVEFNDGDGSNHLRVDNDSTKADGANGYYYQPSTWTVDAGGNSACWGFYYQESWTFA
jgi:hypothetical protein